jgi:hypothetical protein
LTRTRQGEEGVVAEPSSNASSSVRLGPRVSAPRLARWRVRNWCSAHPIPDALADDAALVAGEMVATTVRLRSGYIRFSVTADTDGVLVRVWTDGRARAGGRTHTASITRSFSLVTRVARSWGVDCAENSYEFWAVLRAPRAS